jgi:hypothetical protein
MFSRFSYLTATLALAKNGNNFCKYLCFGAKIAISLAGSAPLSISRFISWVIQANSAASVLNWCVVISAFDGNFVFEAIKTLSIFIKF